jgi:large subunit ribosomal protein L22
MSDSSIATAKTSSLPGSIRKVNLVLSLIRGIKVNEAINILKLSKKRVSLDIIKLLNSAVSNAKNRGYTDVNSMKIETLDIGKSIVLKRHNFAGRGRASTIKHSYCRVKVDIVYIH